MTATAVALLSPCMGFTFGITIPGSVGMGQQIAQVTMFSGSGLRAIVLAVVILISIVYVMVYAARVKKNPQSLLPTIRISKSKKSLQLKKVKNQRIESLSSRQDRRGRVSPASSCSPSRSI